MKTNKYNLAGVVLAVLLAFGVLAFGALKTFVLEPKTVSSEKELLSIFFESRQSIPPLPSPIRYEDVMDQLAEGRGDFFADPTWAYVYNAGIYYLAGARQLHLLTNDNYTYR